MFNFLKKLSKNKSKSLEDGLAQNGLPFDGQENAEAFFFARCDKDLTDIQELNAKFPDLALDFKAKSLARFEDFYFRSVIDRSVTVDISKERMEELLTQYMRQVFVANEMAEWAVFENDFAEGRYDLGLMLGYGSGTSESYARDLEKNPYNSSRTYLFNKFMMYVPAERENEVL